jgi:hypothetical protein
MEVQAKNPTAKGPAVQGSFTAATREETRHHVPLHAREAHGEDPNAWSKEIPTGG